MKKYLIGLFLIVLSINALGQTRAVTGLSVGRHTVSGTHVTAWDSTTIIGTDIRFYKAGVLLTAGSSTGITAADTAAMLANYISRGDTAAMLTVYIARGDTAAMLANYISRGDTSLMLYNYIARGDTAAMLTNYIERKDTSSMLTNYIARGDTVAMLEHFIERKDTAMMLVNYTRHGETRIIVHDSVTLKVDIADTAAMLSPYTKFDEVSPYIIVASSDATAKEKANADYICDGNNDEVQWNLADTEAAGGIVKLVGNAFNIEDDITLSSTFIGIGAIEATAGTYVTVSDQKMIRLVVPGDLRDMTIKCATRSNRTPMVQMLVDDTYGTYDYKIGLLSGLYIKNDDNNTGVGLQLYANPSTAQYRGFYYNHFGFITVRGFSTNVSLKSRKGVVANFASLRQNVFEGFNLTNADTMIVMDQTGTAACASNIFKAVTMQANGTEVGIYIPNLLSTSYNMFPSIILMDWGAYPGIQLGGTTVTGTYARGNLTNVTYAESGMNNNIVNTNENPLHLEATESTIASNILTFTNGPGLVEVEGEGAASDLVSTTNGLGTNNLAVLKRNTAGQVITLRPSIGLERDLKLENTKDVAVFLGTTLLNYRQQYGPILGGTKITVGHPGDADTDFAWTTGAGHAAQNLDLGAIVPRFARIIGVEVICTEAVVGNTDFNITVGNASAGAQFITSASADAANEVRGIIDATLLAAVEMSGTAATNIWLNGDPTDNNWSDMSAGEWSVVISYLMYPISW